MHRHVSRPVTFSPRLSALAAPAYVVDDTGIRLPWKSPTSRPAELNRTVMATMPPPYRAAFVSTLSKSMHRGLFQPCPVHLIRSASRLHLVFKNGKARLCADQSYLTPYLTPASCVYESPLLLLADPDTSSFVTGDFWGAYQRLRFARCDRQFLGVIITDGPLEFGLVFGLLSFGLSHCPVMWEAAASKVMAIARAVAAPPPISSASDQYLLAPIALLPTPLGDRYVDDAAVPDRGRPEYAIRGLRRILATFALFDCPPAVDKTFPWPCSYTIHFGLGWDAPTRTVRVTDEKAASFKAWAIAAHDLTVPLAARTAPLSIRGDRLLLAPLQHAVQKVAGMLSFLAVAVTHISLFRGPLDDLLSALDPPRQLATPASAGVPPTATPLRLIAPPAGIGVPPSAGPLQHVTPSAGMGLPPAAPPPRRGPRRARLVAANLAAGLHPSSHLLPIVFLAAARILEWWISVADSLPSWIHRRFARLHDPLIRFASDASDTAWAAIVWLHDRAPVILTARFSAQQASASSGFRELVPYLQVLKYLRRHGLLPKGATIAGWTDSQVARAFTERWCSTSVEVLAELRELWAIIREFDLLLELTWCSRSLGWIPVSDAITRLNLGSLPEYSLPRETFLLICVTLGTSPAIDLFATAASSQCEAFCARSLAGVAPQALAKMRSSLLAPPPPVQGPRLPSGLPPVDPVSLTPLPDVPESGWLGGAFDITWQSKALYAFPPWSQVPRTLATWASIPSFDTVAPGLGTSRAPTSLLLVTSQELYSVHLAAHVNKVASIAVPKTPHLIGPDGRPAIYESEFQLFATLLRR